ncbi:hypothetical protein K470DRAFT_270267 [Piedraia hortae CBS 480.64]|uniref:Uncharacterized protein n=1 Tax=Piedraia hortae CBS 480.64 TaxID=1314780 RepID=A0A6A7C1E3_9PEZI|nr:hypothetical protein K470DRAFT_270267 [Piedraia hortae CBS 480.64]
MRKSLADNSTSNLPSNTSTSNTTGSTSEPDTGPFGCKELANSNESALSGSGIALVAHSHEGFDPDYPARLFYQDTKGRLRQRKLVGERSWSDEMLPEVYAKMNTPLTAVANWPGIHLFYLDQDSQVQEWIIKNETTVHNGPLNTLNPPVGLASSRAMQACGFGYWTTRNGESTIMPGITLYFASNETTVDSWLYMNSTWQYRSSISNVNASAGVHCYHKGGSSETKLLFTSADDCLEVWTDNYNQSLPTKDCQVPTPASFTNHETYIGASDQFFYTQDDQNRILYRNVTLSDDQNCNETVSFAENPVPVSNTPAIPGTRLNQVRLANVSGQDWPLVAFQTERQGVDVFSFDNGYFTGGANVLKCEV